MNRLRQFCATSVLLFTLTLSTFAGDIHCGVVDPPAQQSAANSEMATGDAATTVTSGDEDLFIDPVTGLALDILQSLLSVF